MSANRMEASSYLSAMMLRDGSFSRSAIVAGRILVSSRFGPVVLGLHRLSGATDFAQRVPDHRDDHHPGGDHREDETRPERPIRLHASVIGNEQLERDDRRGAEGSEHRREHDVVDTEDQHHDRRRDEVVELQARAGAQVPAHNSDRCRRRRRRTPEQATSSPNRYNSGIIRKIAPLARLSTAIHTMSWPTIKPWMPKKTLMTAPMRVVTVRTRRWRATVSASCRVRAGTSALERHLRYADGSHLDHHGESVIPWMSLPAVSAA